MKREETQIRRGAVLALVLFSLMFTIQMLGVPIVGAQEIFPGPPPITPRWAFEPWAWEDNHNTQDSIVNLVDQYQSRNIPVGAVIIDSPWSTCYNSFEWNTTQYPDLEQMIDSFRDEEEVRVLMWLTGFLNQTSEDTEIQECVDINGNSLFDEVKALGYSVDNGDVHWWWKCKESTPCGRHVDFTKDAAKDWWHMLMDKVLVLGIDGWKTDRGAHQLGATVITSINDKMSNEDFRKYYYADIFDYTLSKNPEAISFARPMGAATHSTRDDESSRYAPVSKLSAGWGGDYSGNFDGLTKQMNHMYDSAKAGYGAPGIEVGGFFDDEPTKFSLIRYAQLGALSPIMENGGANGGCDDPECSTGAHLPWHWGSQTVNIYRYYATLHSELTPYLFSYSVESHLIGDSIIRGSDKILSHHRLGEEIFVSVINKNGDSEGNVKKPVIFPSEDNWIDYWDQRQLYTGGSSIPEYQVVLEKYPIFIKAGAIIPTTDVICRHCVPGEENGGVFGLPFTINVADYHDAAKFTVPNIVLNIYPFEHSSFMFHRPTGDGIDYEDVEVTVDESTGTIQVDGQSSESYRLRVKNFMEPISVDVDGIPLSTSNWHYDDQQEYVIIDMSGSDFTIKINELVGYSSLGDSLVSNVMAVSGTTYPVITNDLVVGALQYVDRPSRFTAVPENLLNATYIKTANDDKLDTRDPFLTFDVSKHVTVYVALDDRLPLPTWMADMGFEDSTLNLFADGTPGPFSLYSARFPAGMVSLGGNEGVDESSMYTVVIIPDTIPQTNWVGFVDSQELVGEDGRGVNAFDGNPATIWHTQWFQSDPPHPHHLQIDLGAVYDLNGLRYLPRQDGSLNGTIEDYAVSVSLDGVTWGIPVATGVWAADATEKEVLFGSVTGRYIRLEAFTEVNGNPWTSAAEVNVLGSGN